MFTQLKFYMSKGIGDERYVADQKLFDLLKKVAEKYAKDIDIGGNASTMAWRAYLEGCSIKAGFPLNQKYFEKYFGNDSQKVDVIGGLSEINDYHLSLNYFLHDEIWGLEIPRSNRIFINHDVDNNDMRSLDSALQHLADVDIVAIGGTQLPSNFSHFIAKLSDLNTALLLPENKDKIVHLESSAFSNYTFYEKQLDLLLPRVRLGDQINSFGMNEREFLEFYRYLMSKVE